MPSKNEPMQQSERSFPKLSPEVQQIVLSEFLRLHKIQPPTPAPPSSSAE